MNSLYPLGKKAVHAGMALPWKFSSNSSGTQTKTGFRFPCKGITQNPETWLKSLEFLQVISDNLASFRTFTIHGTYKQVGQNNIWAMCLSALDPVPTDSSERAVCLHGASQTMISANLSLRTFQTEGPTQMWLWNMTFLIKYSRCKSESFTYYLNINERRKNCECF